MKYLLYFTTSISILFFSYRLSLYRSYIFSILAGIGILVSQFRMFPYEAVIFTLFINALPIMAERFKQEFNRYKVHMRCNFEEVKDSYEELRRKDRQQMDLNLERERRLHQVLSLYEISKDMSTCLTFEDIFTIFSATLKKSFRFRLCRLVFLKVPRDIDSVYQIELGHQVKKATPDDFDRELVAVALESKRTISVYTKEEPQSLRRLSMIKNFETLISVPLVAEDRIAALIYIENISKAYFENFTILAAQFAIQFQKVILYKKVQEMSITDSLTGIGTRRHFLERFREEIRRSMRHKSNLSLLMLDLDHFKANNDRFGHLVGDVVLKEVADILRADLREIDIVGRYGGEEFAIVLAGIGRDGAFQVAGRIREKIEGMTFKAYDEVVSTTVSIGVGVFPDDGVDVESLIESADRALYKAKELGRNRVC